MKGTYLFLAEGFEITEALTTVDILRRGGVELQTVSIYDDYFVTSSNEITVLSDLCLEEFLEEISSEGNTELTDLMVFPGGMPGSVNLSECEPLMEVMKTHYAEGGTVAAICAAPSVVLGLLDGIDGKKMTCYDGFEEGLLEKGAEYVKEPFAVDGNIITGRGAGVTVQFALAVLAQVKGQEVADKVKASIML